ncbi:hypothetical protein AVEN_92471-1 [Araneus ventricosus]|uniref:Uncharacterized protein n=1 Tax=Araneus ventricosus TaxID=182803 RepID=A0A4Y2AIZ1_ARAVE|nr:hypothetical protein AVEN_92471-1 [Araneus ventricosus]
MKIQTLVRTKSGRMATLWLVHENGLIAVSTSPPATFTSSDLERVALLQTKNGKLPQLSLFLGKFLYYLAALWCATLAFGLKN